MLDTVKRRPTETGSAVIAAITYLICYFAGITDQGVYLALGVILAFVPAALTWLVTLIRGSKTSET